MRTRMTNKVIKALLLFALGLVIYGVIAPFANAQTIVAKCCPYHEVREGKVYSIKVDHTGKYHYIYFGERITEK
jgi:hypothetical protein